MRNDEHRLSRGNRNLIIFTEPSGMIKPGEGTLNHPSPREFFPLVGLDFNININVEAKLFLRIRNESPPISGVCAELLDRWISFICLFCGRYSAFCVMNISSMNHNRQQAAQHIYCDVPFSAFRFFPRLFLVLRWLLLFSHSGNQWSRSLDSPCVQHLFVSFLQDAPEFYPTAHWSGHGDKNCVRLNMVENHAVTVSIYTLNLPNTARHPSIPVCSTCSCPSLYTVALFLPTVHLSSRSATTPVFFLPCLYFTTNLFPCEYRF